MTTIPVLGAIAASGGAGAAPGLANDWHLAFSSSYIAGQMSLFEAQMREEVGGSDIATSGQTIQQGQLSGSFPGSAVWDNNISTRMVGDTAFNASALKVWSGNSFPSKKTIRQIQMYAATSFTGQMPGEFSLRYKPSGVWKTKWEWHFQPDWVATEARNLVVPDVEPTDQFCFSGIEGSAFLANSTSLYATKGNVFTAETDITIFAVHLVIAGTTGTHQVVIGQATLNGSVWDIDTVDRDEFYEAVEGFNEVRLTTPLQISAGTTFYVSDTFTDAASDTTSSGLRVAGTAGAYSNPLFSNGSVIGLRTTTRDPIYSTSSTDTTTGKWAIYPQCYSTNGETGLNTESHRYWRFTGMDCAGSSTVRVGICRLLDSNGHKMETSSIVSSPTVSQYYRFIDGLMDTENSATTDAWTITYDFGSAVTPAYVQITIGGTTSQAPTDWVLEYSDDNSSWTPLYEVYGETWTADLSKYYKIGA